jgi:hypothetical protein
MSRTSNTFEVRGVFTNKGTNTSFRKTPRTSNAFDVRDILRLLMCMIGQLTLRLLHDDTHRYL